MKNTIILFLVITALTHHLNAQIPNSGFESWTTAAGYVNPDGWGNLNPSTTSTGVYTCMKGTPGNPGTAYLKLVSKTVTGMGVLPGIAVCGTLNPLTFKAVSGFACTSRPASLKGKWQFMAYLADQGYISVYLTKWNASLHRRDTIGSVVKPLPGMVMSWQDFSINITYTSQEMPDSAVIICAASGSSPVTASYLYLDNLSFSGNVAGIEQKPLPAEFSIFPNPVTKGSLMVDLSNRNIVAGVLVIFDLSGRATITRELKDKQFPVAIDVSTLPAGTYILKMSPGQGIQDKIFIKQ